MVTELTESVINTESAVNTQAAINYYLLHKKNMKTYIDSNRDKIYKYNQQKYKEMMEDPEKHEQYKARKRRNYQAKKAISKATDENIH